MSNIIVCPNCFTDVNRKNDLKSHILDADIKNNDQRIFKGHCKNCDSKLKFKIKDDNNNRNGILEKDCISFLINGKLHVVKSEFSFSMTLNDYLRTVLNMTGTKVTCHEGGCGACVVNAEKSDSQTNTTQLSSINTCLFPLYSCDQMKFTTIEGVGNKLSGFSEVQKRIADFNGSQCGWCTPGMVMNMYGLLLNNPKPTKQLIENSFDGNICRCTGYRPILDAMKSFAFDEKPIDIEELCKLKCLNEKKFLALNKRNVHIINDDLEKEWFIPNNLDDLFKLLTEYQMSSYKIVGGNTGTGVYKNDGPFDVFIDIKNVPDLHQVIKTSKLLSVGSSVQLKNIIDIMNDHSSTNGFEYLTQIAHHLSKIANVPVRNAASWSGNLMLKYNHNEFPSDVFICFETIGALLTIIGPEILTPPIICTPSEFLNLSSLKGKLLYSVNFSPLDKLINFVKTYKIMPRSQNAHAYVNAGFRFSIDPNTNIIAKNPAIVYGGLCKSFVHAEKTESFLTGKVLNDVNVLIQAFKILSNELVIDDDPVLASIDYRRSLALSLFYKFILYINDKNVGARYKSAKDSIIDLRPISSGQQSFPTDPTLYPITKPMKKLNAYLQASGEAQYVYDKAYTNKELHGVFIQSSIGNCNIDSIDTSAALGLPGVVKIIFAKDIPGINSFIPLPSLPEILFCDDFVDYAGQAIGLVVAESHEQAKNAAKTVKITYKNIQKPILNIFDAIKADSFFPKPVDDFIFGDAEQAIKNAPFSVENEVLLDTQFPFHMENHVAIVEPTDDGFDVNCSTQWLDLVQNGVAQVLNISNSSCINVKVKQVGGGYGNKITRSNLVATAAALACKLLNKPVRVALDINSAMEMIGKRFPWYAKYKIGFDQSGKILGVIVNFFCDSGNSPNDNWMAAGPLFVDNAYMCKNWKIVSTLCKTNLPANTYTRSPGYFPSICTIESMIEHVAKFLKTDPLKIRQINLYQKGDTTPSGQPLPYFKVDELINDLIVSSDYVNRLKEVNDFNKNNRWKKKGISMTPIKWGVSWTDGPKRDYNCSISVYVSDGSVSVSHGGIEIGQGIHTKISQVTAFELDIPMDLISIKHPNTSTHPNVQWSGASVTSELCSKAIIECCRILKSNLEPVKKIMPPNYSWLDLITKAFSMGIDLTAHYWLYPSEIPTPFQYNVYGAGVSEAIIDVLTGEAQILRTDILYDGGQSTNASIDIGQAEGAFVMGLGYWLYEKVRYDPNTGKNLSNGTWEYKDIPIDFRINFLMNSPNTLGVLGSKCIGEPPLCLSPCVAFAVKKAIEAARDEIENEEFFRLDSPATVESIQLLCLVNSSQFKLND